MKATILTYILLCFCLDLFGQNTGSFIYQSDFNVLYRGYRNPVEFGVSNGSKYRIELEGLELISDTTFHSGQYGKSSDIISYYLLVKGSERYGKVIFIDEQTNDTIGTHTFHIKNLPVPELYWGTASFTKNANIRDKRLFVKYPNDVPLNVTFAIKSWKLKVNKDFVSGMGNDLSDAESILKKVKKKSFVYIEAIVIGPDGIERILKGKWQVGAWKKETPVD